jgi:hypothetical protein
MNKNKDDTFVKTFVQKLTEAYISILKKLKRVPWDMASLGVTESAL